MAERAALRVLVADDHEKMRDCLVKILEREFDVIGAVSDGYELIDTATRLEPDVVVSDVLMPGLNGTAAMMNLQAGGLDIPFVFVCSDKSLVEQVAQNFGICIHKVDVLSELRDTVIWAVSTPVQTCQTKRIVG